MNVKHEDRSLAYQIITYIFIFLFLIFFIYVGFTRILFSRIMLDTARETVSHVTNETVNKVDSALEKIQTLAESVMELKSLDVLTESELEAYLLDIIYEFPQLNSVCLAYDPSDTEIPNAKTLFFAHNQQVTNLSPNLDYKYSDWFQIPYQTQHKYWTEPWFDDNGPDKMLISYCLPIFKSGKVQGVMRFDTELSYLQNMVSPLKIKKYGYAFLISHSGTIITHPADSLVMNQTIFSLAEEYHDDNLRIVGRSMLNNGVGFKHIKGKSPFKNMWLYYSPLQANSWSLGVVIAHADVINELNLLLIIQTALSILLFFTRSEE
ncbi:MAG: cache domain-containing protein, partial [Candidatus Cloacimonas sp.]|nr:cache domain-containing protein [Candidatus Cloacimonas sp.]